MYVVPNVFFACSNGSKSWPFTQEAQDGAAPWDLALDALTTMKRIIPRLPDVGGTSTPQSRSKSRQREELEVHLDPDQYHHHKRKLKKAILEHYQ